jgi:hypothetical protein
MINLQLSKDLLHRSTIDTTIEFSKRAYWRQSIQNKYAEIKIYLK